MDYQSFQPGGQEQSWVPTRLSKIRLIPFKNLIPKFIDTILIFVAFGMATSYSIWWWGNQQMAESLIMICEEGLGNGEDQPVITSISPNFGSAGAIIEVGGCNFSGFEGDKNIWIKNETGTNGIIYGEAGSTSNLIKITLPSRVCQSNNSYSGLPCDKWLDLIPGTYQLYTEPWSKKSNEVDFTIKAVDTSSWKTYTNSQYGFEFKYPTGINSKKIEEGELLHLEAEKDKESNTQMDIKVYHIANFLKEATPPNSVESSALSLLGLPLLANKLGTEVVGGFVGDSPYGIYGIYIKQIGKNTGVKFNGVIVGKEDRELFKKILFTFKFTNFVDETATWQTYRNDKYGFELRLPPGWVTKETIYGINFTSPETKQKIEKNSKNCSGSDLSYCITEGPFSELSFSNQGTIDLDVNQYGKDKLSETSINGIKFRMNPIFGMIDGLNYETTNQGKVYHFDVYNYATAIDQKILSTFRFIP